MKPKQITAFGGVNSAFNSRDIDPNMAQMSVNARVEDGTISPRFGIKNKASAPAGFTASYAFEYLHGYDSGTEKEEFLSVETVSGNTKAYAINPSTLARTEITNGGGAVTLHASEWVAKTFRQYAYLVNPNNSSAPVYRHAIGSATSMTAIAVPAAPTVALTYVIKYGPGGTTPYSQLSFAGIDPTVAGEVACTGAATNTGSSLLSDDSLSIRHTNSEIESSFEVDLNDGSAGVQDWTYRDNFAFSLTCETNLFNIDPGSVTIELRNNDGTPKVLTPSRIEKTNNTIRPAGTQGQSFAFFFAFEDKIRADFDNVRYFKVSYRVAKAHGTVANNDLIVTKPWIGGVQMVQSSKNREPGSGGLYLHYTYYYSGALFESGFSPELFIPNSALTGTNPFAGLPALGVTVEVTATASGDSNVDEIRYYVLDNINLNFRRLVSQTDADLTYDVRLTYAEITRLTEFAAAQFTFAGVTSLFAHKGMVVWLYDLESENVRLSRVGDPIRQASDEDNEEDLDRGRTMSLANNYGDKPLGGVSVGDGVMVAGEEGVYSSLGDYGAQMTPFKKVAGSVGVAGKQAFDRWKDDSGVTGMVYVATNGQVYFSIPGNGASDGDTVSLSEAIRDGDASLKSWLLDGQNLTDYSTAKVRVNERDDTLVIIMGKRALKLRRPDQTGKRNWEPEEFNRGSSVTISYAASSIYGLRWITSDGKIDEDEFDYSARQYVEGVNRDGGNPMPSGYWRSKTFVGQNRRILRVFVERTKMESPVRVRVISKRMTQVYTIPAFRNFARCHVLQQGFEHEFEVLLDESTGSIQRLYWEETALDRKLGH